jgi:[protein-PII] uridylyltransferase
MLLILTNADIHAVGPGIWNAWKEGLLSELYYRSLEEMEMTGGQPTQRREVRVERAKAKVRSRLHSLEEATVDAFISRGYSDYWLAFDVEEHVRHFEMIGRAETLGRSLIVEARQHPSRDVTEITIYAPDHAGLFARIAGAIALSGGSIVDAKVITLANSMALDVLHIQDLSGRSFDSADRIARLTRRIEETIVGRIEPGRELKAVRLRALPTRTRVFTVPPRVIFDNRASASHTVIEVNGRDRPGFLLDVTSTLTAQGLQIVSAHISTYGERVVDVFYVKDVFGLKVEQAAKLERIERELLRAIGPQEEPWEASQQAQEAAAAE